ncbi:hypothetical protein JF535_15020 [Microbulbifer salipaludis]|uniref:Flagellar basal body protein n=1 Tax=Microbulbifer salipaludis TaxID=187980 RepID=A0ABS3EA25_9GAMM|nr:flagellar basal body rod C-terminal domain-containing protein [Microbulbifer salipaludis]MBN8432162.1 hypothetical protein [Microbulbifer salipaludis]
MSAGYEYSLKAIQGNIQQVELLSQNVANIGTPGYMPIGAEIAPIEFQVDSSSEPIIRVRAHDVSIKPTGSERDLAVIGDGYLWLESRDGSASIAKSVTLTVNPEGVLTNSFGLPVLDESGSKIVIHSDFEITRDGIRALDGSHESRIALVSIVGHLSAEMVNGAYRIQAGDLGGIAEGASILQGHVVVPNMNSASEMISMMQKTKHVESVQRALMTIDSIYDTGINQIGK